MYSPLETVVLAELSFKVTPWIVKATLVVVAETPATSPSSNKIPVERLEAVVQRATKPLAPDPVKPDPAEAMVICPAVVVVIVMLVPATRFTTPQLPEPCAPNSWPAKVGEAVVAVPPLPMGKTPETSELPKATAALNRAPAALLTTPVPRLEMVVEPVTVRVPVKEVVAK